MVILDKITKKIFSSHIHNINFFSPLKTLFIFLLITNIYQIKSNKNEIIRVYTLYGVCNITVNESSLCSAEHTESCSNGICKCKEGYTTPKEDKIYQCCYEQKSAKTAFLLEAFLGFGAGHFYVGDNVSYIKALIYFILFVVFIITIFRVCFRKDKFQTGGNFYLRILRSACLIICGCTFIIWQMVDSVMFSLRGYKDKNGVELY